MIVEYINVIEVKDSFHPYIDYKKANPNKDISRYLFLSDQCIEFQAPLTYNKGAENSPLIHLKRDDTIIAYSNHLDEPLWRVEKNWTTGAITLWPSIRWAGSDPSMRQHFWFRNMKAEVLPDSWNGGKDEN